MINTFGERLAKTITSSRQHRNTVASNMGMTRSRMSDLIKGIENPTYEEIEHFARLFQTTELWLLTGKHSRD